LVSCCPTSAIASRSAESTLRSALATASALALALRMACSPRTSTALHCFLCRCVFGGGASVWTTTCSVARARAFFFPALLHSHLAETGQQIGKGRVVSLVLLLALHALLLLGPARGAQGRDRMA
jgi:hypothetical protein